VPEECQRTGQMFKIAVRTVNSRQQVDPSMGKSRFSEFGFST
jgi:hypothetical protein